MSSDDRNKVPDELARKALRLRELGKKPPTPETREEVAVALQNKWEGIQAVAINVLGAWGGPQSRSLLQTFLKDAFQREAGWAIRGVAIKVLGPLVDSSDAGWVLDLYFDLPSVIAKHEVFPLVIKLPTEVARKRLASELRSVNWMNRQAAVKAIGNMQYSDAAELLRPLCSDAHERVRESAQLLSQKGG